MFFKFRFLASLTSVNEYIAVSSGRRSAQLTLSTGTETIRADVWNSGLIDEALKLPPGCQLALTGRISGKQNDRGYFNYSFYADDFIVMPAPGCPKADPTTAPAQPLANEDIPF